jgi:hypothetical protein
MKVRYGAQATPGGTLIASQNNIISVYNHEGDVLLDAGVDTDAEGFWEYVWVPTGSAAAGWVLKPGPLYWILTYLGRVRRGSTKAGGLVGSNSLLELPELFMNLGEGVHLGAITGDFAVTIPGGGMTVSVAAGYGSVRGIGVDNSAAKTLNVTAAHATLPRIDTVVLELVRTAGDTEGKVTLKIVNGTANASPVAPTLTQDVNTWQYPLYDVRSNAAVTTPTSVTDRRTYPSTNITKNPTLIPILYGGAASTALTTTPTSIASLQQSVTLVNNVWYDILCEVELEVNNPTAGSTSTAVFINGTSNAGTALSLTSTTIQTLKNAHSASVLGTGAAITCGVLAYETGGDGVYYFGMTTVTAVPRS